MALRQERRKGAPLLPGAGDVVVHGAGADVPRPVSARLIFHDGDERGRWDTRRCGMSHPWRQSACPKHRAPLIAILPWFVASATRPGGCDGHVNRASGTQTQTGVRLLAFRRLRVYARLSPTEPFPGIVGD